MFAVIKSGGKQYRVAADDVLQIGNLAGEAGDIIEIGHVLAFGNGDDVTFGAPFIDGALVTAEIVEQAYLRTLTRYPTPDEIQDAVAYMQAAESPRQGVGDLLWALINTKEFIVNH